MNLTSGGGSSGVTDPTTRTTRTTLTSGNIMQSSGSSNSNESVESIISNIYESTYAHVGDDFLDSAVEEIAKRTGVQTVMIHRLLTLKEYEDLRDNEGCPCIELVKSKQRSPSSSNGNSPSDSILDEFTIGKTKLEFMLLKACYSSIKDNLAFKKYAAVPIAALLPESPHLQTLRNSTYHVAQNASSDNAVYPVYNSFVGVRFDINKLPIGLITVMHDKPMSAQQTQLVQRVLAAVQLRTRNEIEKIRQRDNLIMVKNAALQDAESKIKFLADMSHEIRTPMNAVIALTDLLLQERDALNDEQAEHLEVIQTSGNHLLTVINDILDISKINHDPKFKLENRRFSLKKCVKDALNMARHQASMTQYNKLVCVGHIPADVNDNIPLKQLIKQIEKIDPLNSIIVPQYKSDKTVIPLLWKIDSNVPDHLMGDTMRLTQILLNLCSNAVKFTKSGGIRVKITRYVPGTQKTSGDSEYQYFKDRYDAKIESIYTRVMKKKLNGGSGGSGGERSNSGAGATTDNFDEDTTEEDAGTTTEEDDVHEKVILEISVTDTGIGMPADRLPRLFKSFSQIDISTARRYGGTGLGLAISSMLVNRMGGGLWVESEEGRGSRFALTLPLAVAPSRRAELSHSSSGFVSESSSTYASSGMIASPPSPGSSISDGGSSVGDRSVSDLNSIAPSSPSNSTGYFPLQLSNSGTPNLPGSNANLHPSSACNYDTCKESDSPITNLQQPPPSKTNVSYIDATAANSNLTRESLYIPSSTSSPNVLPPPPSSSNETTLKTTSTNTTATTTNTFTNTAPNTKELQNMISKSSQRSNEETPDKAAVTQSPTMKPKGTRIAMSKQFQHHKKSSSSHSEENLALLYPIKIMLAEDNVLNQKIAISILKRLGYQDVVIAGNGRDALNLMRVHKFDVIFMDLYMPEMDGLEATRFIISERKHNVPPPPPTAAIEENKNKRSLPPLLNVNDVYIIALTASASKQDRQICIDAGMNDFISKPFTMMEMKSALKNCASKRKKRRKQQLRDEMVQKQLVLQQQQQEIINNALMVQYNDDLNTLKAAAQEACGDEDDDEDDEGEGDEECCDEAKGHHSRTSSVDSSKDSPPLNVNLDDIVSQRGSSSLI